MAASYPTSAVAFTRVADNVDAVEASHVNLVYTEVEAIESVVGSTPQISSNFSGTFIRSAAHDFGNVNSRVNNLEFGVAQALDTRVSTTGGSNISPNTTTKGLVITAQTAATANLIEFIGTSSTTSVVAEGWIAVIDGGGAN